MDRAKNGVVDEGRRLNGIAMSCRGKKVFNLEFGAGPPIKADTAPVHFSVL
jgi:hypothetical protein